MTPELLAVTLRSYVENKEAVSRVGCAVLSHEKWTGAEHIDVAGRKVKVKYCRSMLEMRENLLEWDRSSPLALLTPVEDHLLAADLRARLHKQKVKTVKVWEVLKSHLSLRLVDPRLELDDILGKALVEIVAVKNVAPPISGVLHEDAAWDILLPERFGIPSSGADIKDLLLWSRYRKGFDTEAPDIRQRMIDYFVRKHGGQAKAIFDCCLAGANPIAVGLAYEPLVSDVRNTELARAFGRMERFTNNQSVPHDAASQWSVAAQEVMTSFAKSETEDIVDALDRTLTAVSIDVHAHLSRWSRVGATQALDRFAVSPSEATLDQLRERQWPGSANGILDRGSMLLRLNRWLDTADPQWTSFTAAVEWYGAEGSWVDWARSRLRFTSESSKWNAAVSSTLEKVRVRRETQNLHFAQLLAAWTRDGAPRPVLGVESVIDAYVKPLADLGPPVLFIVMDGMSLAIARELASEFVVRRWNSWSNTNAELQPAVAALPSITTFSRASLLSGRLTKGGQDVETRSFESHPALRRAALFHKNDLAAASDEVLREIANTDRRVVGIVVNAIDEELSGSRQVAPDWTLEYLAVLRGILAEAATAGRIVIVTSDHGHMLDTGTSRLPNHVDPLDRWRTGELVGGEELEVKGSRVVIAEGKFIGLGVESARYGRQKVGYHGGLTPQECLAPVMVLSQPAVAVKGWEQVTPVPPPWWSEEAAPKPGIVAPAADWVEALVRSEVFEFQLASTNGRVSASHVEAAVRALDTSGGRLLKNVFAGRVGITPGRVSSYIAAAQRVLNVESYGILELDETSQTITLNRPLLVKQFKLG